MGYESFAHLVVDTLENGEKVISIGRSTGEDGQSLMLTSEFSFLGSEK